MADERDIEQNIIYNFKTNALETAKAVDVLTNSTDEVNESKKQTVNESKKEEQAYKSMRSQVREATQEMYKMQQTYGATSKEAIQATKRVAELKDQIADATSRVEGFNPDRKFQAAATAINATAVAASGVTSGMALFGQQSEETEKALLKVQAAMAFSDAVGRITEMGDDFTKLKAQVMATFTTLTTSKTADTVATEVNSASKTKNATTTVASAGATTALTGATTLQTIATTGATIATNILNASLAVLLSPITLVVLAVGGLIAGIAYLSGAIGDFSGDAERATIANTKLNKEIDNLAKTTTRTNEQLEISTRNNVAMAKAQGMSTEQVRKLKEEMINAEVVEKRLNALKAQSIFLEARRVAGLEDATDEQKETSKKAYEFLKEQNKIYEDSVKTRKQMAVDHKIEIVAEEKSKNDEIAKKQKEHLAKLKEERKKAHEEEIKEKQKLKDDLGNLEKKYLTDLQNINDKSEQEKLDRQKERDLVEIEALRKRGADVSNLLIYNDEKYKTLQFELDEKNRLEKEEKDKVVAEKKAEDDKTAAEKQIEIDKFIADAKQEIQESQINNVEKGVALLSSFAGKNKALQKAAIIAENAVAIGKSIISTNAAIPAINLKYAAIPGGQALAGAEIAANKVSSGISIATSIAATAKALSALGGGGGASSGGGGAIPSTPIGGSSPQVGFQSSTENQIANSVNTANREIPPIQAFVVSQEMTTAQQLDRNKIEANSLG